MENILLPLPRVLNPLRHILRPALNAVSQRCHSIPYRLAHVSRDTRHSIAHAAASCAYDPARGFGDAADGVAEGGGHEGGGVVAFAVVEGHFGKMLGGCFGGGLGFLTA